MVAPVPSPKYPRNCSALLLTALAARARMVLAVVTAAERMADESAAPAALALAQAMVRQAQSPLPPKSTM
eukprot:15359442-Alexandrium_andersonii.AAC.1